MRTMNALLIKQGKDSFHNLPSLMILMIYPAVAFIMTMAIKDEEGVSSFLVPMFAAMHCSFSPLVLSSNILSEEKEKGTLRSLIMAGVGRVKYMISLSLFVMASVMLAGSTFLLTKSFHVPAAAILAAMLAGTAISTVMGLCIGICSKNVTAANGMAVPVGLVFALVPMLGQFNDDMATAAKWTYSGQLRTVLEGGDFTANVLWVSFAYFIAFCILLIFLFKRKGLE